MKICDASGVGVCVNCNRVPPKIHGYSCGDICTKHVEDILAALEYGNIVCYNSDTGKFYEKTMYEHPRDFIDEDWECIVWKEEKLRKKELAELERLKEKYE